jgi:DNA-binding beta-propeller fold protein YncE
MTPTEERLRAVLADTADTVREDTLRPLVIPARRRRRWPRLAAPIAAAAAVVTVLGIEIAVGHMASPPKTPVGAVRTALAVRVGSGAGGMAYDGANGTLYVALSPFSAHYHQPRAVPGMLAMVNAAACNASSTSGCGHVSYTPTGGRGAADVVVDERTHTAYVLNDYSATVAVINTATCNAVATSGCSQHPAQVRLPVSPARIAINPRTDSIYVTVLERGQFAQRAAERTLVINGTRCNASETSGCVAPLTGVPVGAGSPGPPLFAGMAVDPATNTIYAGGRRLAVIDGRTCDGTDMLGCVKIPATIPASAPSSQSWIAFDSLNGTIYATVAGLTPGVGAVAIINGKRCNALDTTGCAGRPVMVRGGPGPGALAVDPAANTLYVTNEPGTVSMINTAMCNASSARACPEFPAAFPVGSDLNQIVVSPATHTVYVLNYASGNVSVINSATCNATHTRGCPTKPSAGTPGETPYSCDDVVSAYQAGEPAGPLASTSVRVASGTAGTQAWSLWARKGVVDPYGIEQGGLVLNGRWYPLCSGELSAGPDGDFDLVDAGAHGIVYGYIQHPTKVTIRLGNHSPRWTPQSVQLPGTTFFILQLPRSACAYHGLAVNAWQGKHWGGYANASYSTCLPGKIVSATVSRATWGPDYYGPHW